MKINIDFNYYRDLCFDRIREYWNRETDHVDREALALVLDAMEDIYGDDDTAPDVDVLVDNLVVNSEIVPREEFCEDGNWCYYFQRYHGDWDAFLENCFCGDDRLAVVRV